MNLLYINFFSVTLAHMNDEVTDIQMAEKYCKMNIYVLWSVVYLRWSYKNNISNLRHFRPSIKPGARLISQLSVAL